MDVGCILAIPPWQSIYKGYLDTWTSYMAGCAPAGKVGYTDNLGWSRMRPPPPQPSISGLSQDFTVSLVSLATKCTSIPGPSRVSQNPWYPQLPCQGYVPLSVPSIPGPTQDVTVSHSYVPYQGCTPLCVYPAPVYIQHPWTILGCLNREPG